MQEKPDSNSKNLNLSTSVQQHKALNISRKVIDTSDFRKLNSKIKADSAKHSKAKKVQLANTNVKILPKDTLQEPRVSVAIPEISVRKDIVLPEKALLRNNSDWVLIVIILSLGIIASVRILFNTYLMQLLNAAVNYTTAIRLFREKTFNLLHPAFRLDMLFYLTLSLFIFQSVTAFGFSVSTIQPWLFYLICLAALIVYFLLKRFLYMTIAILTESQTETLEYLFNVNIYNRILGVVLFPVTIIIAFSPVYNAKFLILIGIVIFVFSYLLLLFRGSKILLRKHFSISYLILYLCTLEFLPLFVIFKIITR